MRFKSSNNTKAFSLLELMIVMGVIAVLVTLGIVAIFIVQKKARDSARLNSLAAISKEIVNYKRSSLKYPTKEKVVFNGVSVLIDTRQPVTLKGAAKASNKTTKTSTLYYYKDTTGGYMLCAILESGIIQNVGTEKCPDNTASWI